MFRETIKAGFWGMLILIMFLTAATASLFTYIRTSDFYSESMVDEYKKTLDATSVLLSDLELYINQKSFQENYWSAHNDDFVNKTTEEIKVRIKENCPNCNLSFFTPSILWDVTDFKDTLERKADKEKIFYANAYNLFLLAMSLLTLTLSIYLLSALLKYKKLTAIGIFIIMLLVLPVLISSFALMIGNINNYMHLDYEGLQISFVLASVVYMFVVYPVVFTVSKSKNFNILTALKLNGYR